MTREEAARKLGTTAAMVLRGSTKEYEEAIELAIEALKKTSDKNCSKCLERGKCAIYDNFNIDYCSDWRME